MKLLRDPLLHFLVIGALLFGAFELADADGETEPGEIVVSAGQVASLTAIFGRTWQRPPGAEELDGLVADYIRDEVLYREAVAMGLDRDDAVVRRRMRQKMEFVADLMADVEPTDAELKAYVAEHPERFRPEPRFSFSHVYFKPEGGPSAAELQRLAQALDAGAAEASETGDPFMPGFRFEDLAGSGVAQIFGEGFAESLERLAPDRWGGPVTSAYGLHLVRVSESVEPIEAPFEGIRDMARREWLHARKIAAGDALFEQLRSRYVVRIEDAPAQAAGKRLAEAAP